MSLQNSVVVIDQPGAYIRKSGNRFILGSKSQKQEFSADKITQFVFAAPSAISSEAIRLAVDKNIDLVYLDYRGAPYARIYRTSLGGTTLTRKKQLEATASSVGLHLIKKIVAAKIGSQHNFLRSLAKDHKHNRKFTELVGSGQYKNEWSSAAEQDLKTLRFTFFGIEGAAAAHYFKALGLLTGFARRDPKLQDEFNICLNYAYGMLYSEVERACILAGLDPYLGFYHTDRYGKPCLVLDVIELFRVAVADRATITLFNRKEIKSQDFDTRGSLTLSEKGKRKIINAVIGRFNTRMKYKGKRLTLKDIILSQTREVASYLLGHSRDFKPFVYQ